MVGLRVGVIETSVAVEPAGKAVVVIVNTCGELTSLVALLQLKVPNVVGPWAALAAANPAAVRSSGSAQVAARRSPP